MTMNLFSITNGSVTRLALLAFVLLLGSVSATFEVGDVVYMKHAHTCNLVTPPATLKKGTKGEIVQCEVRNSHTRNSRRRGTVTLYHLKIEGEKYTIPIPSNKKLLRFKFNIGQTVYLKNDCKYGAGLYQGGIEYKKNTKAEFIGPARGIAPGMYHCKVFSEGGSQKFQLANIPPGILSRTDPSATKNLITFKLREVSPEVDTANRIIEYEVDVKSNDKIKHVKSMIKKFSFWKDDKQIKTLKLFFGNKELKDKSTCADCNIRNGSKVYMVIRGERRRRRLVSAPMQKLLSEIRAMS